MGTGYSVERGVGGRVALLGPALVGAALLGLALAGCSSFSSSGVSDWFPSVPGFSSVQATTGDRSAMAAAEKPWLPSTEDDCPSLDIRQGAATLAIANKTQQATANDLRYQLTFTRLARQCALNGPVMRMRVGVQGRVLVGPAGAPNEVNVPVRYAVVQEGVEPKTITTKFRRFPVAIPPGELNVAFTDIEEDLSFPIPDRGVIDAYVVYVGFDEAGDRTRPEPKKKAAPKRKQ
jgi:hypothetical protein